MGGYFAEFPSEFRYISTYELYLQNIVENLETLYDLQMSLTEVANRDRINVDCCIITTYCTSRGLL